MDFVLVRYAHFIAIIVVFCMLTLEHVLVKEKLSPEEIKKIVFFDLIYGISALIVLAAGLTLWLAVGKPAGFYSANPIFHAKLTLFILTGLISLYPTRFFLKQRKSSDPVIAIPKGIVITIRLELTLLLIVLLLAVLMAQGYGL